MKKTSRLFQVMVVMILLSCFTVGISHTAQAASSISSVTIQVEDNGSEEYPTITLKSTDKCEITEEKDWEELSSSSKYERVRKTFSIEAKEGYEFDSKTVRLSGTGKALATVSVSKSGKTKLIVKLTYKMVEFYEPDNAYWDYSNPGRAVAEKVEGAKKYEFVLYVDDEEVQTKKTSDNYWDFSERLKRSNTYRKDVYFEVCAIDYADNYSEYVQSNNFNQWSSLNRPNNGANTPISNQPVVDKPGGSNQIVWPNGVGKPETEGTWQWQEERRWIDRHRTEDGLIDGYWDNGYWYFVNEGKRMYGWIVYQGEWYFLDSQGRAYCNTWVQIGTEYYYFYGSTTNQHKQCQMARNTYIEEYYVNNDGVCTNWQEVNRRLGR